MSGQIAVITGWVLVAVTASVTLGEVARVALLAPRVGAERMSVAAREVRIARVAALCWVGALVVLSLAFVARDRPAGGLISDPAARAALAAVVLVAVAALMLWLLRRWVTLVPVLLFCAAGALPPVITGWAAVGVGHDIATDALVFGAPATMAALGASLAGLRLAPSGTVERRRFRLLAIVCSVAGVAAAVLLAVVYAAQGGGLPWPAALFVVVAVAQVVWEAAGRRENRRMVVERMPEEPSGRFRERGVLASAALAAASVALLVSVVNMASPASVARESVTQRLLGFDAGLAPTLARLALDWHVNLLFAVPALFGVAAYLYGVRRLHQRGDAWPAGRTVAWICGWVVIVLATSSGLGAYASAAFSAHMALHMAVNMLGPLLLVLGGGVTLLLRASRARRASEPAGVHEWVTAVLGWGFARSTYNPLFVFVRFVGAYYILYLTPLFGLAVQYRWSYQLMNVEFLAVGYVFYGMAIGVDPLPRSLPHIGKLAVVLAAMPFHAFFGVVVMSSSSVIAGQFYHRLHLPWIGNLLSDQYLGGGIAWAGELPLIIVVLALVTQWARQDAKQAKRTDRHLDSGLDDSYDAYNQMLAKLAQPAERELPRNLRNGP